MVSRALTLVGVLGVVLLGGCDRKSAAPAQPAVSAPAAGEPAGMIDRSHRGAPIPALTLHDDAGGTLALASLKGAPVLVNLWATWCAPCVIELPQLDALAAKLRVVTVSEDLEAGKGPAYLAGKHYARLPRWQDPDNDASTAYKAATLPMTIYYDAAGREVWRYAGGHDWTSAETGRMLAEK